MDPQDESPTAAPELKRATERLANGLYMTHGQGKPMGVPARGETSPHFFLVRHFGPEVDLLIIFNTRRCRFSCNFCALPFKSTPHEVPESNIVSQFTNTLIEVRHALGVLERVTLSNEGSVLDESTFGPAALEAICAGISQLKRIRRIELETRMEFVTVVKLKQLAELTGRRIGILTGFETVNGDIRRDVLGKHESLSTFLRGMDRIAESGQRAMTAYILFKPDWRMSDADARVEALASLEFLAEQSRTRSIDLTIRVNPMYMAPGTPWTQTAKEIFVPPRLTDVLDIGRAGRTMGLDIYVGLSTEGLPDEAGTYRAREDFGKDILVTALEFNRQRKRVANS